jgi:hypothetical protein
VDESSVCVIPKACASVSGMTCSPDTTPTLDHLGWIGPDLDASAEAWRRLGFTLSRVSPQMGFTGPGGTLEPWASANQCAVFEDGYLELIGITDAARHNPWEAYLKRGTGPHIAAFRVETADATFPALDSRVPGFLAPVQRRRMAPLGVTPAGGEAEMRFRNIFSQDEYWPEGRFIVIEHQTPEVLWQPVLMTHPNGAHALVEAVFTAPDIGATSDRLSALLDRTAVASGNGSEIRAAGGGLVSVLTPALFSTRFPGAHAPDRPAVAAAVVSVRKLSVLEAVLAANGIPSAINSNGERFVTGDAAGGGVIAFVEE